ncbi:MAG: ferritin family protein [Magnetococcales bacterium]|nr:ferritin family protein [Magnetococcales bacterium]
MKSFEEIIKFAMQHEDEEAAFYESLADRSQSQDQKNALLAHAAEEREHKRHLEKILENGSLPNGPFITPDQDMELADLLVSAAPESGNIDFEDALILASKREKSAEKFYHTLAGETDDPDLKKTLIFLAEQEAKHANQLEREYDDGQQQ